MPAPHTSTNFGDLLDPRFTKIFYEEYKQLPDMVGKLFTDVNTNGRNNMTWSNVGTLGDFTEFTGAVGYQSQSLGYNTTMTPVEFTNGIQVERKLFDDDQFHIMDQKPRALALSAFRTRQKHAARPLNNAFSVDSYFFINSEGVALCSDNHTTTSGASVATGFDNKVTSALTATAVAAARIQMVQMRGDQGERIAISPDELWGPPDLYEQAYEIISSMGKVDTANNNRNVHEGVYTFYEWNYLTSTKNWFMCDSTMRKQYAFWSDRVPLEFAMAEDLDTLLAKWRAYMRYGNAVTDWRWITGASVT
jgi:phage major head subunit gpT-like protein